MVHFFTFFRLFWPELALGDPAACLGEYITGNSGFFFGSFTTVPKGQGEACSPDNKYHATALEASCVPQGQA
jgi:hypothetical protein